MWVNVRDVVKYRLAQLLEVMGILAGIATICLLVMFCLPSSAENLHWWCTISAGVAALLLVFGIGWQKALTPELPEFPLPSMRDRAGDYPTRWRIQQGAAIGRSDGGPDRPNRRS